MVAVCTCRWSSVNTASIDPPYLVSVNPECSFHGFLECAVCGGETEADDIGHYCPKCRCYSETDIEVEE